MAGVRFDQFGVEEAKVSRGGYDPDVPVPLMGGGDQLADVSGDAARADDVRAPARFRSCALGTGHVVQVGRYVAPRASRSVCRALAHPEVGGGVGGGAQQDAYALGDGGHRKCGLPAVGDLFRCPGQSAAGRP
ncbi:hypothetical protein GCM10010448_66230 [Streptomyces glomeratus]|uniref:Uncharacterized protein n=1 Tax=Streptomyces glomeratus TaxID=284452 RepID=A0ABP6M374_9ACTN